MLEVARKEFEREVRAYANPQARVTPAAAAPRVVKKVVPLPVIRDEYWNKLYESALKDKFNEEDAAKFADSAWRCRKNSVKLSDEKKKHAPPILAKPPPMTCQSVNVHKRSDVKCQARTLENRPCPFRASSRCGKFCSKHAV
jgi:hypothetical protein